MKNLFKVVMVLALALGLGAIVDNQNTEAASCNGVNKVVEDQDGATMIKHVYLNSCETTDKAAEIQNTADMNGELADVAGLLPGVFKVMELPPAIASAMEETRAQSVADADNGNGVILTYEKDLNHKDVSMHWIHKSTASQ